ncbi:hypothetical protein FOA52_002214 [Chlamydomonas sp. UWO 241]|nr:hypothetical protein FOA52_002214 [Chlamydomonas sp. UWO 241]
MHTHICTYAHMQGEILDSQVISDSRWRQGAQEEGTVYKMAKFDDAIQKGDIVRTQHASDEVVTDVQAIQSAKGCFILNKFYKLPVFSMSAPGDQLRVVLASKYGKPLSKKVVSSNFDPADPARPVAKLAQQALFASLTRAGKQIWSKSFKPADVWYEYVVHGYGPKCEAAGADTLNLQLPDESGLLWSDGTSLVYEFMVAAAPATQMTAQFVDSNGRAGNRVAFPEVSEETLVKAVQWKMAVIYAGADASAEWDTLADWQSFREISSALSSNRLTLSISGFNVPGRQIREVEGARGVEAALGLRVPGALLDRKLNVADVDFRLFSGNASRIVFAADYEARLEIAKGELLRSKEGKAPVFSLEDAWGNTYVHGQVDGDPPPKALVVKVTNVSTSSGPFTDGDVKFDKAGKVPLPDELYAYGPVNSYATVSLCVEPLGIPADNIINRRIFPLHLDFTLPLLAKADSASPRPDGLSMDASTSGSNNVVEASYILDRLPRTKNGTYYPYARIHRLVDEVNGSIQRDVFLHEVAVVVAPGARKVTGLSVQVCKEDDSVDTDWSASIKRKLVCGDKELDLPDLHYHRGAHKGGGSSTTAAAGMAASFKQPFKVELPPGLFDGDNAALTVSIVFYDCHSNLEYVRCYVRQVRQPVWALLLPIGHAFAGVVLRNNQEEGMLSNVRAQEAAACVSPGDDTPDPFVKLAGWSLVTAGAARTDLHFDHFGRERTLSVQPPGLPVRASQPFRVYFVCPDAFGLPMELPSELCGASTVMASAVKIASRGGKSHAHAALLVARVVEESWMDTELHVSTSSVGPK